MPRLPRHQRGAALLETALIMPLLIGTALISADLYNVHQARNYMEQSAHNIATILAAQSSLDVEGLDALIEQVALPKVLGRYEMVISKVSLDRSMTWKPLYRGSVMGVCPSYSQGKHYTGEIPEYQAPDNSDEGSTSKRSIIVVQLCRSSNDLALSSALLMDKDMQALAFSRMLYNEPTLDKQLTREVGKDEDDAS